MLYIWGQIHIMLRELWKCAIVSGLKYKYEEIKSYFMYNEELREDWMVRESTNAWLELSIVSDCHIFLGYELPHHTGIMLSTCIYQETISFSYMIFTLNNVDRGNGRSYVGSEE